MTSVKEPRGSLLNSEVMGTSGKLRQRRYKFRNHFHGSVAYEVHGDMKVFPEHEAPARGPLSHPRRVLGKAGTLRLGWIDGRKETRHGLCFGHGRILPQDLRIVKAVGLCVTWWLLAGLKREDVAIGTSSRGFARKT